MDHLRLVLWCLLLAIDKASLESALPNSAIRAPPNLEGRQQSASDPIAALLTRIQEVAANQNIKNPSVPTRESVSRIRQGVYVPDARFNAFVDGVMVNMVAEMKRLKMDPLFFRVHGQGIVEHVVTRVGRDQDFPEDLIEEDENRQPRQESANTNTNNSPSTLGGGVIQSLRNITRFGNAEVQIAGNTTLIRSHWLMGPLRIIIDFRDEPSIRRVRCDIQAVQLDTLTVIDRLGAEMEDCELIRPLFGYIPYYGNRTLTQQTTAQLVVEHLFSENSFMTKLLREAFRRASYDKIIPQYGADDTYYSMLKYLFSRGARP